MRKLISIVSLVLMFTAITVYAANNDRPKGTCPRYIDKNNNGFCDLSESMKCRSKRCVASRSNTKNDAAWKEWESDKKELKLSDQKTGQTTAVNGDKLAAQKKLPCSGNCAGCPMAGACC